MPAGISPHKNVETLIDAYAQVARGRRADAPRSCSSETSSARPFSPLRLGAREDRRARDSQTPSAFPGFVSDEVLACLYTAPPPSCSPRSPKASGCLRSRLRRAARLCCSATCPRTASRSVTAALFFPRGPTGRTRHGSRCRCSTTSRLQSDSRPARARRSPASPGTPRPPSCGRPARSGRPMSDGPVPLVLHGHDLLSAVTTSAARRCMSTGSRTSWRSAGIGSPSSSASTRFERWVGHEGACAGEHRNVTVHRRTPLGRVSPLVTYLSGRPGLKAPS